MLSMAQLVEIAVKAVEEASAREEALANATLEGALALMSKPTPTDREREVYRGMVQKVLSGAGEPIYLISYIKAILEEGGSDDSE